MLEGAIGFRLAVNEARVFSAKPKQSWATSDQLKIALKQ